jgi:hypothetical protein
MVLNAVRARKPDAAFASSSRISNEKRQAVRNT